MPPGLPTRHVAIHVEGVVQGVGFRPFVFRIATARGLVGWVRNGADGVRLEVRGPADAVSDFLAELREHPPPQAQIRALQTRDLDPDAGGAAQVDTGFRILESDAGTEPRPSIPADLAICADCAAEIASPGERRHRYPFTNCTQCGPRYSLIAGLPYDRARTGMVGFALCRDCEAEYRDPLDRRFHAQPIACPACGPRLELLAPDGTKHAVGEEALDRAAEALRAGQILALKGLGGFQLLADATSAAAVDRLRVRKRREAKPFAVMFPYWESLAAACDVSAAEAEALQSPQAPIVLVARRRPGSGGLAEGVAPGNPRVGALLPYTPLHRLLLEAAGRPLVCTSGNLSEEPMCTSAGEALDRLSGIADLLLSHDRPILRPVDDSVARMGPAGLEILRRARGYAPLPVGLAEEGPTVLALGAHQKATIALARGREAAISQHLGDLGSVEAVRLLERTVEDLLAFHGNRPDLIACDLHPEYTSTRLAEDLAAGWRVPLVRVQHHHAHAAALAAEHGLGGDVLALTWDGTGYGLDGTIWGGEALLLSGGTFRRVAALRCFRLPGGEAAMREPRRALLGLLGDIGPRTSAGAGIAEPSSGPSGPGGESESEVARRLACWFGPDDLRVLRSLLASVTNSPGTSSMGRLFDAISALVGLCGRQSFEGEAAMALEFAADAADPRHTAEPYLFPLRPGGPAGSLADPEHQADWEPLLRQAAGDLVAGAGAGYVAARFHAALAELAVAIARAAGVRQVALGGGCFQNLRLARLARRGLESAGFEVFSAGAIPPNDGGIALGQILVARRLARA